MAKPMKIAFSTMVLGIASIASSVLAAEWYQGGTLHDATVGQWKVGSSRDRLATASDWTTGVIGQTEFERIGIDGVKALSEDLVACINESVEGLPQTNAMKAAEIGAACIILLGWR